MKVRIYSREWFYNAGLVGFIRILEHVGQAEKIVRKDNYIEIETQDLKDFNKQYFQYFFDIYDIRKKMENRIEKSLSILKLTIETEPKDKEENKKLQERIKQNKKYIKQTIKTQLDKIKKFDTKTYDVMIDAYNRIDGIKEKTQIEELEEIFAIIIAQISKEHINKKLTLNLFKSILSNKYFGQPSFLNVVKSATPFEEQEELMYRDYISNIVETGYLKDFTEDKYTKEELSDHMLELKESQITKDMQRIHNNISKKFIQKDKVAEEIKQYIKKEVLTNCHMCENEGCLTSEYTESNFVPLAISSDNMKNFFWNQNAKFPICDICKLLLFCIPAGVTSIIKTVKENNLYKEKEVYSFINYDTDIDTLVKKNNNFKNRAKLDNAQHNPYEEMILDIVGQEKKISEWQIENIFFVEFEAEYLGYSRMEYFNIRPYVAKFFAHRATESLSLIQDYRYKLQIVDYLLKDKDIARVTTDRIRDTLVNGIGYGYNSYLATKVRMNLNLLKKEDLNVDERIDKNNKKLYALYNIGTQIHTYLDKKGEANKLNGYTYKMLNSIKSGNKKDFMDIVIRLHMSMGKDISPIFLEAMQEGDLDLYSIGHSFLAGLISNKYEKKENEEVEGNE